MLCRSMDSRGTSSLTILSETGPDLKDKFPTEKQFCSWLNVVPDNKISGGKVISSTVKKKEEQSWSSLSRCS